MHNETVIADPAHPPLAIVQGTPLLDLPEDLYIPPDALEVFLETFEGPLDLLLYLIKKDNFDILDIPIAQVTEQYLCYIEMMGEMRLELAAEYLLMAALLAEIKSRLLLPKPPAAEESEEDPRAELVRRLQEYEIIKQAAEDLDRLPRMERDCFAVRAGTGEITVEKVFPEVQLPDLLRALQDVLRRAEQLSHHQIVKEPLSVRERMAQILTRLGDSEGIAFPQLFNKHEGRHGVVVSFLAILELGKEGLVEILQAEPLADLLVRLVGSPA